MSKYHNSFLFEEKSRVKSIEKKDNFFFAEFIDTIFYPGGGGQPCDTGIIVNDSFEGEVIEVEKQEDKIIHKIKPKRGELKTNDEVNLIINKERRMNLIRMHTGEHILYKSLENILGQISLNKIDLGEDESTLFINADEMTWKELFLAEELANKIIDEDRQMIEKEYPKTDAVMMEKVRIKPERIKSDTVRILEVKDFDWSACHGTHAKSTSFVGNLLITRFNFAKGCWEIRFKVNVKKDFFDLSRIARESATLFEADVNNVISFIRKLKEEAENYKEKFRKMSYKTLNNYSEEKIKEINFVYNLVEDIEKKQLVDKSSELLKEKTIICFLNRENERITVLLNISKDLNLNAPELLNKALSKFNGKGGGKDCFAMGSIEKAYSQDFLSELKKIIGKL